MYDLLPTPNSYRTASGMPGKDYFQQRADYLIHVTLDDNNQILRGKEKVTFYNNSQDALTYIWIQLDQNQICLLYTSDAADERSSVDLGGRRIIKKKK